MTEEEDYDNQFDKVFDERIDMSTRGTIASSSRSVDEIIAESIDSPLKRPELVKHSRRRRFASSLFRT